MRCSITNLGHMEWVRHQTAQETAFREMNYKTIPKKKKTTNKQIIKAELKGVFDFWASIF